jgi:hypothetical protein
MDGWSLLPVQGIAHDCVFGRSDALQVKAISLDVVEFPKAFVDILPLDRKNILEFLSCNKEILVWREQLETVKEGHLAKTPEVDWLSRTYRRIPYALHEPFIVHCSWG